MKKSIFHYALSSLLVGGIALSVTSCTDDDINPNQGNNGDALVRFSINDVQEQAVNRGLEMTRGAIANGITTADLAGHKLAAHSNLTSATHLPLFGLPLDRIYHGIKL